MVEKRRLQLPTGCPKASRMQDCRKYALAVLLIVMIQCLPALCVVSMAPANMPGFFHPHEFGVQTLRLSGPVSLKNGSVVAADVIVYLKALQQGSKLLWRGMAHFLDPMHFEHVKVFTVFPIHYVPMAPFMEDVAQHPSFWLRMGTQQDEDQDGGSQFSLATPVIVSPQHEVINNRTRKYSFQRNNDWYHAVVPYIITMEMSMSELQKARYLKFCIDQWYQCTLLTLFDSKPLREQLVKHSSDKPLFLSVLKPLFSMTDAMAEDLLRYRWAYHAELGFHGTVLYERGSYLSALAASKKIRALVDRRHMLIMCWSHEYSGLPILFEEAKWGNYDQWFINTHAALSFWGMNTYLFMADVDEFLVLPRGMQLPGLMKAGNCLHNLRYMQLSRKNYQCEHRYDEVGSVGEYLTGCTQQEHDWGEWGKCIVHADAVSYFLVHDGFVFDEYREQSQGDVPESCARVVHLVSLLSDRVHNTTTVTDDSWMWAANKLRRLAN